MPSSTAIEGYASLFWIRDLAHDVVARGAFARSLSRRPAAGVRMLHQHAADAPIGVWDQVAEDRRGLMVRGRIIEITPSARHAAALVRAGALDGLSIGYQARAAHPDRSGRLRILTEIELLEISLVSFPMLPGARLTLVVADPSSARQAA